MASAWAGDPDWSTEAIESRRWTDRRRRWCCLENCGTTKVASREVFPGASLTRTQETATLTAEFVLQQLQTTSTESPALLSPSYEKFYAASHAC